MLSGSEIAMSPSMLSFRNRNSVLPALHKIFTVSNMGESRTVMSQYRMQGRLYDHAQFHVRNHEGGLPVNASCKIVVTFSPLQLGKSEGQVSITNNEDDKPANRAAQRNGLAIAARKILPECLRAVRSRSK